MAALLEGGKGFPAGLASLSLAPFDTPQPAGGEKGSDWGRQTAGSAGCLKGRVYQHTLFTCNCPEMELELPDGHFEYSVSGLELDLLGNAQIQ